MSEIQKPDWSPLLETGDLRISLYAGENGTGETIEIRDGQTIYAHLTGTETADFLKWIDGRDRDTNPEWQPIETAPKDGTPILLFWKTCKTASVGRWSFGIDSDGWKCLEDDVVPKNQHCCTHWMPIPEPPKK